MRYRVSIKNPCDESWEKMSPSERGRSCQMCKKEVTDFTNFTDAEVIKSLADDSVLCGRFLKTQINRALGAQKERKHFGFSLGVLSFLTLTEPAFAQNIKDKIEVTDYKKEEKIVQLKKIKGQVLSSEDDSGLPGVNVIIKNTTIGTVTDFDGYFEIDVDLDKSSELQFSGVALESVDFQITKETEFVPVQMVTVQMKESLSCVTMGVVVIAKKQNIFRRFLNFFKR